MINKIIKFIGEFVLKTVKIRIIPTEVQKAAIAQCCDEMTWLWNLALKELLRNHCVEFYKWAAKQSGKLFPEFDLEGIIETPVMVDRASAWIGVSCRCAAGGNRWKKDESIVIPYKSNGATKYRHGYRLEEVDDPWKEIAPEPHRYSIYPSGLLAGREIKKLMDLDRLSGLNAFRNLEDLPALTTHSDYIGGLLKRLETSWKEFLSPNNVNAKKPKFKRDNEKVDWLFNFQKGGDFDFQNHQVKLPGLGIFEISDRSYRDRIEKSGDFWKSYAIKIEPSGYYLCASFATSTEDDIKALEKEAKAIKASDPERHEELKSKILYLKEQAKKTSKPAKKNNLVCAVDPGINAIVATNHGALFQPNYRREKIQLRLETLQSKLDNIRNINDANWKAQGKTEKRPPTKNEQKLEAKISRLHERSRNSAKHFNHKLSTRLARTYGGGIVWEDTDLLKMFEREEAIVIETGGYAENGQTESTKLNWRLRQRNIGQLRAFTDQKAQGFELMPASLSSQTCSECKEIGLYEPKKNQSEFFCQNPNCSKHLKPQQADVNAAINFADAAEVPRCDRKYHLRSLRSKSIQIRNH